MRSKLLADENIPWPLVRLLRIMGLDILWIPETSYRGISDDEVVNLANRTERIVLTRDSDYLKPSLRGKVVHGILYIGEPIRKDNVQKIAENIIKALEAMKKRRLLAIVTSNMIELYLLKP